jgi:hypothetical protein
MLILRGTAGIVAIVKVGQHGQFFLETENEEIVLGLEPHDLIVASALSLDEKTEKGLKCVLFMIREIRSPLIVLPKNHPASPRLPIVVSAGNRTVLSCKIAPGTHPNQDVLCGSNEFDSLDVTGTLEGVHIKNMPQCEILRVNFDI